MFRIIFILLAGCLIFTSQAHGLATKSMFVEEMRLFTDDPSKLSRENLEKMFLMARERLLRVEADANSNFWLYQRSQERLAGELLKLENLLIKKRLKKYGIDVDKLEYKNLIAKVQELYRKLEREITEVEKSLQEEELVLMARKTEQKQEEEEVEDLAYWNNGDDEVDDMARQLEDKRELLDTDIRAYQGKEAKIAMGKKQKKDLRSMKKILENLLEGTTLKKIVLYRNSIRGALGENVASMILGGIGQQPYLIDIETINSAKERKPDVYQECHGKRVFHEIKTGKYASSYDEELEKDMQLVNAGKVDEIIWHFFIINEDSSYRVDINDFRDKVKALSLKYKITFPLKVVLYKMPIIVKDKLSSLNALKSNAEEHDLTFEIKVAPKKEKEEDFEKLFESLRVYDVSNSDFFIIPTDKKRYTNSRVEYDSQRDILLRENQFAKDVSPELNELLNKLINEGHIIISFSNNMDCAIKMGAMDNKPAIFIENNFFKYLITEDARGNKGACLFLKCFVEDRNKYLLEKIKMLKGEQTLIAEFLEFWILNLRDIKKYYTEKEISSLREILTHLKRFGDLSLALFCSQGQNEEDNFELEQEYGALESSIDCNYSLLKSA